MQTLRGAAKEAVRILSPDDGFHYFFGYYDLRAGNAEGKHLCHRVKFMDRLPTAEDEAELGWLEAGVFHPFAVTTAWNFQQGAMLQYHASLPDTVYYNKCENGKFQTVTHNYVTGQKQCTDRAAACISPDGKWGLGINFGRIFDFRPGYGYAGFEDAYTEVNVPKEDGVFLIDMQTGVSRQLLGYDRLGPAAGFDPEDKILINHITFNPASDAFIMLVRSFPKPGRRWSTSLIWSDLHGNLKPVLRNTYFSHYDWVAEDALIAHCTVEGGRMSMYRINTSRCDWEELDMPYFHGEGNRDIHCKLSPDGKYIIGDGYPLEGYRHLMAYRVRDGACRCLLEAKTVIPAITDLRCDLHARFLPGGEWISFDSTHNGCRQVAAIPAGFLEF